MIRSLLFACLIFIGLSTAANHIVGGEVYYTCITSGPNQGKFIFHMKLYRTCDVISAGLPPSVVVNNPLAGIYGGAATIICTRIVTPRDISPKCYSPGLSVQCGLSHLDPLNLGALEENYYESLPVQINGIPPAGGADFYFTDCCRRIFPNIANNGPFYFKATMYPSIDPFTCQPRTLGSGSTPSCYDGSPRFAAKLDHVGGLDKLTRWRNPAYDPEGDQLVYRQVNPQETATTPIIWSTGFSVNSPIPNSFFNASNQQLVMDSLTGYTEAAVYGSSGLYVNAVRVDAYRNGNIISSVLREYPIVMHNPNSDPYYAANVPPVISFKKSTASVYQADFSDTINIGQSLDLEIKGADPNFLSTAVFQTVSLEIDQTYVLGSPFNPIACPVGNCATVSTANPDWDGTYFSDTLQASMTFHWQPGCELFQTISGPPLVNDKYKTYAFTVHAKDNFCPIPNQSYRTFYVTVRDTVDTQFGFTDVIFNDTATELTWRPPMGGIATGYSLYRKSTINGSFNLLASISNPLDTVYLDADGLSNHTSKYYALRVQPANICLNAREEIASIVLSVTRTNNVGMLSWNKMYRVMDDLVAGKFYVEVDTGLGWQVRDSLVNDCLPLTWRDTVRSCLEKVYYRIRGADFDHHIRYLSNVDSLTYLYPFNQESYVICSNDSILLAGAYRKLPGSYFDTAYTVNGCEEVTEHMLDTLPAYPNITYHLEFCEGDSIQIRNSYFHEPGEYTFFDTTSSGCDSISKYYFKHVAIDDSIYGELWLLKSMQDSAMYQWIDCADSMPVAGGDSQTFYRPGFIDPAYMAVIITYKGCIDTTDCVPWQEEGVEQFGVNVNFDIYPNPVNEVLHISTMHPVNLLAMEVFDVKGQRVFSADQGSGPWEIRTKNWNPGIYYLKLEADDLPAEIHRFVILQ